ncbi:unnamed protein product [Phytophthora lilii]|uniref:Unnamed protein product n=1 Tax=Phytophthora lilii TaxID=2077276 RepID=A0A9W6TNZ9_9STRA|nr:unnamed protein product [Phytophthora lilii]
MMLWRRPESKMPTRLPQQYTHRGIRQSQAPSSSATEDLARTMAALLERTQKLRQHIEALIRRDAAKRSLPVDERALRRRVDDYYLPMFRWTTEVVEAAQRKQGDAKRCVCIGLSCPQGGGKTTASMYMQEALGLMGKKCAVMSLDDVYWKYEQQVALAKANLGNPLLQAVNKELRAFDKFYEELDGLVVIKIDNLDWVYQYVFVFVNQSIPTRVSPKKPAMTPDEVRDFVDRFMPAYKTYLKGLYADPKDSTSPLASVPRLIFSITSAREPAAKPVEFNFSSEALQD